MKSRRVSARSQGPQVKRWPHPSVPRSASERGIDGYLAERNVAAFSTDLDLLDSNS